MGRLLLFLLWCVVFGLGQNVVFGQSFPVGEVIERVVCEGDSGQAYALYLPSEYDEGQAYPIIYVFDPIGRGKVGVEVFEQGAEVFGYIVACTYNSRNGPFEPTLEAFRAMVKDTDARFSLDSRRLYLSGFSGGARAACSLGRLSESVVGVIGCGAGFLETEPPDAEVKYDYVGIVGMSDMNHLEMHLQQEGLDSHGIAHQLYTFDGGHSWAMNRDIMAALSWFQSRARARGLLEGDSLTVEDSIWIGRHQVITDTGLVSFEKELWETYLTEMSAIALSPYKGDSALKSISWWKKECNSLMMLKRDVEKSLERRRVGTRMLDYIIRASYTGYMEHWGKGDMGMAKKYLKIWQIASPDQAYPHYHLAKVFLKEHKKGAAIKEMEKACEKGFKGWDSIEGDVLFDAIRHHKKFVALKLTCGS